MKKLNSKGFTLVELLAVIIILAIVVGITIPAVLTTTNNTKKKAFKTAAESAADWFDRQYSVYTTGLAAAGVATQDATWTAICVTKSCISNNGLVASVLTEAAITAAGLKPTNIVGAATSSVTMVSALASNTTTSYVMINSSTGRSCVKLVSTANGDYPVTKIECGGICSATQCASSNT